jgi:hypothetical protein
MHKLAGGSCERILARIKKRGFAGINFVEPRFVIDWKERQQILKLELPTVL